MVEVRRRRGGSAEGLTYWASSAILTVVAKKRWKSVYEGYAPGVNSKEPRRVS